MSNPYTRQIEQLINQVAEELQLKNTSLVTVESCTGGGIGYHCTALAGASSWYQCGYITYHNQDKINLGVPATIIQKYGAVSIECAEAMAKAAATKHSDHYILSVTGIAGPDGGSRHKPVGTVCFGWRSQQDNQAAIRHFDGNREAIRLQSIRYALHGLIRFINPPAINNNSLSNSR